MHPRLKRRLAGRTATLRHDILALVIERSGHAQSPHSFVSLAYALQVDLEQVAVAVEHLGFRDAVRGDRERITVTPLGRSLFRDQTLLSEGRNEQDAWVKAIAGWLSLLSMAIAIGSACYQWMNHSRMEDRIDQLEKRIELVASPAPVDSLPMTGR